MIQTGDRVVVGVGKNAGLEYEVVSIEGAKARVRSLRTGATGTCSLDKLRPVENSAPVNSPVVSPAASPATGENLENGSTAGGAGAALLSEEFPAEFPAKFSGHRGKVIDTIQEAIAMLEPRALVGAWITTRNRGGRSYYSLRQVRDGKEIPEVALKGRELGKYQQRVNDGRVLVRLREVVKLLNDAD